MLQTEKLLMKNESLHLLDPNTSSPSLSLAGLQPDSSGGKRSTNICLNDFCALRAFGKRFRVRRGMAAQLMVVLIAVQW